MTNETIIQTALHCPKCEKPHIDVGEWETRPHHKHLCHYCHYIWKVYPYTAGINDMRDMGSHTEYAKGFDSGCKYSAGEITELKQRRDDLLRSGNDLVEEKRAALRFAESEIANGDKLRAAIEFAVNHDDDGIVWLREWESGGPDEMRELEEHMRKPER